MHGRVSRRIDRTPRRICEVRRIGVIVKRCHARAEWVFGKMELCGHHWIQLHRGDHLYGRGKQAWIDVYAGVTA